MSERDYQSMMPLTTLASGDQVIRSRLLRKGIERWLLDLRKSINITHTTMSGKNYVRNKSSKVQTNFDNWSSLLLIVNCYYHVNRNFLPAINLKIGLALWKARNNSLLYKVVVFCIQWQSHW